MAMTMDELQLLLEKQELHYFVDPKRPAVMFGMGGVMGSYQCVISLEEDGEFLQFRTILLASCPRDQEHLFAVLKLLGDINYRYKLLKIGWDPSDGEIMIYIDVALEDGRLTDEQFGRLLRSFLSGIDKCYGRIKRTIETGEDPGSDEIEKTIREAIDGPSGPDDGRDDGDLTEI